jgi:hypothetical protein
LESRTGVDTVESLLRELETLLKTGLPEGDQGILARSPALLAAGLLECPLSSLEHAAQDYEDGLARTHALDHLERSLRERGFEIAGYDDDGFAGFYLKVPFRRAPIVVGPDERRDVPVDFWALHRSDRLLVRVEEYHDRDIGVSCWSPEPGAAFRFVEELDRAVEGCALVHRQALRLRDDGYAFLAFRRPRVEPRCLPAVEAAVEAIGAFLERGDPGEHLGALWHGPPGNGKTSMVRRLLSANPQATRLWVDPSALRSEAIEETFALLSRILRSLGEGDAVLVVFEDIDLLSGERGSSHMRTWLSALDGVEQYCCRVCFIGLTNLSPREFDPAVVRPARLGDLVVEFGPPDLERRRLILGDHLGEVLGSHDLDYLAGRTPGFSGAEIELLCRRVRWAARDPGYELARRGLEGLVREMHPANAGTAVGFRRGSAR